MKFFKRFLFLFCCLCPVVSWAQVATTAGSNLTAWNGNSGATNNNNWNQLMNNRTLATGGNSGGATADFGNCNSLILRCVQPKCSGCTTMEIARPVVAGCVNSNDACKKYGDDLIEFIAGQMVSNVTSKAQQAELAAAQMAAQQAALQKDGQILQMQEQIQEMQEQMRLQNEQQMAQMSAALEEQRALTASALEQTSKAAAEAEQGAIIAAETAENTAAKEKSEIDEELAARKQITGQILTKIENAEVKLKSLKSTMEAAFRYAGCDGRGNNCTGPKRVKTFKEKAHAFFEPYDDIVDEAYEGLEMALAVGVDVSDVIMMLSGACNQWGKFLCTGEDGEHEPDVYSNANCQNGRSVKVGYVKGGQECTVKMAVPPQDDVRCTLTSLIGTSSDNDPVFREWLNENYEGDRLVRVGCATSALESIAIFGRRSGRRGAALDLDTLERIILQDAPDYVGSNMFSSGVQDTTTERLKYCGLTTRGYQNLLAAVQSKKLPKNVCVSSKDLANTWLYGMPVARDGVANVSAGGTLLTFVDTEDRCERLQKSGYVPSGCTVAWKKDANGYEYCAIVTGDCVVVDDEIMTKKQKEQKDKEIENNWKNTLLDEKTKAGKCEAYDGDWVYSKMKCFCGDIEMPTDGSQRCEDNKNIRPNR